jgi:hypothetical protein
MSRSILRTVTTAIAIAALAAPTAFARPADTPPAVEKATAVAQHKQDARSPDTIDAAAQHKQDARSPDTIDAATRPMVDRPSNSRADSATRPPLAGPPTWPVSPQPITSAPAAKVTDGGNGVDWMMLGLGVAGCLLAIGAVAGITSRTRRSGRARIAA